MARDEDAVTAGEWAVVLGRGIETHVLQAPLKISHQLQEAEIRIATDDACGRYLTEGTARVLVAAAAGEVGRGNRERDPRDLTILGICSLLES